MQVTAPAARWARAGLAALTVTVPLTGVGALSQAAPASAATGSSFQPDASDYIAYAVQADRAWVHASSLSRSPALDQVALAHAEQMASDNFLFDSANLALEAGPYVPGWTQLGENSAYGASATGVAWALVHSEAHLANILGPYTEFGVATVSSGGTLWVVEVFARQG